MVATIAVGVSLVHLLPRRRLVVGVLLGVIAAVMATLGDLCESVIKRDLGIKDISHVIPVTAA